MSDDQIVPGTQTAQSADAAVTPAVTSAATVQAVPDAAPATAASTSDAPSQTPATSGSEPGGDARTVVPLDELIRTRKRAQQAEQESARLQGQLEEARRNQPTQPAQSAVQQTKSASSPSGDTPPNVDDYPVYEDYLKATFRYEYRQEEKVKKQQEEQEKQRSRQEGLNRDFAIRISKSMDKLPDYHEVVRNAQVDFPVLAIEAIKESDIGPELAYHLAKNPSEADRISKMSPSSAVREIGKLESKLSATPPLEKKSTKQVTLAPEPIKPTGGNGSPVSKDYEKMPMEDYIKTRMSETYERRGGRLVPKR